MTQAIFNIIDAYKARHPDEAAALERSLAFLSDASGDILSRATTPAHITSSLLILQGPALLTIWHPNLEMWIQPGGHVDPGETLHEAALREALEETGFSCTLIDEMPFDIDCLFVPANPRKGEPDHWHIDFRYLMTPVPDTPALEPELTMLCVPIANLAALSPSLARLVPKLQNALLSPQGITQKLTYV
jgi:ADP-ribose pyrophosphatase YjhB (NUDIX family)